MKNGSKKFYILGSIVTMILIVCVAVLIGILSIKPNKTEAATATHYEIVVDKYSTVSVYVTGSGVSLYKQDLPGDEPGSDNFRSDVIHDIYLVEKNTEVTIIAVNELKIFTKWIATDLEGNDYTDVNGKTSSHLTFTPTQDIRIDTERRDATSKDTGKYMGNRFLIEGAKDLFLIQKAFEKGNGVTAADFNANIYTAVAANDSSVTLKQFYEDMFAGDTDWKALANDTAKINAINNTFFARLQTGYYLVSQNFAYLDKDGNMPFIGIGKYIDATHDYSFKGVMCGLNENNISTISLTIQGQQNAGNLYYGLFGYLGNNAVVRNLEVETSIGITKNESATSNVYAGGLAGYSTGAFIYNVNALARQSIEIKSTTACGIYAGSLFGYMEGGVEEYANVVANGQDAAWIIKSESQTNIHTGLLAGLARNTYVNDMLAQVSGYAATVNSSADNSNIYMANLFGKYEATTNSSAKKLYIKNIRISGTGAENIAATINNGNAYVSGLIGHINSATSITQKILIGKINFQITNKDVTSNITATSADSSSSANLYTAGLFARVETAYLEGTNEFKQNITEQKVDNEKIYYRYDFIFNANLYIESKNNGTCTGEKGKAISGGLVGLGLFEIRGTSGDYSDILISPEDYKLTIKATQSSTTSGGGDISNQCIVGLIVSSYENTDDSYTFNYMNVYSNTTSIIATRELSSDAIGDVTGGGFIGYSQNVNYEYINLYLNDSELRVEGLSYDKQLNAEGNNVHAGGFIGRFEGPSTSTKSTINNIQLAGFDYNKEYKEDGITSATLKDKVCGTTLKITSIQNTIPGRVQSWFTSNGDYKGENYTGGLIGLIRYGSVSFSTYYGSESDEDYIQMQCHQSPDSAFCGGLIGFIKEQDGSVDISVEHCKVLNGNIYGAATVIEEYDNPDIYIGGLIGAIYCNVAITNSIENCSVENSRVYGNANENIDLFTGGILGVMTWNGTLNITNTYVYNSDIQSIHKSNASINWDHLSSYAAGLVARSHYARGIFGVSSSSTLNVSNSGVFDTNVIARSENGSAVCGGVVSYTYAGTIEDNYSNAKLIAEGKTGSTKYGIGAKDGNNNPTNSFYVLQNATGATKGTALDFANQNLNNSTAFDLFSNLGTNYKTSSKYYVVLQDDSIFAVNTGMTINYDGDTKTSNNADVYVNIREGGNTTPPTSYTSIDDLHGAGWFKLGTVLVYNGGAQDAGDITAPSITYPSGSAEYKYQDSIFKNLNYPYDDVEDIGYTESDIDTNIGTISFKDKYTIKVRDNIPQIKIAFKIDSGESALTPIFYDASGNVIDITSEEGTYTFTNTASGSNTVYEFVFTPNTEITNDTIINIGFKIGSTNYLSSGFQLDIKANKRVIEYLTYADYTPPINYKEVENLGSSSNPYLIKQSDSNQDSVTKLIPVFTRINDLPIGTDSNGDPIYPEYNSELNVDYVNYTISSGLGTMKTNGEFVAATGTASGTITATLKNGTGTSGDSKLVNVSLVSTVDVTYSAIGAEVSGLTYATSNKNYILDINCMEHYGGIPTKFNITIGSTSINLLDAAQLTNHLWITNDKGEKAWDLDSSSYRLVIPNTSINGDIDIEIEMNVVYSITFDLQCEAFNPNYTGEQTLTFKVLGGDTFSNYFTSRTEEINDFLQEATSVIDGYLCTGFFLVNEASSVVSYGVSFDELKDTSIPINTSYTFYARWNFLIELVEAPGTSIMSRFKDTFMIEIKDDEYSNMVNRTIAVPINANKGYVFSVEKEDGFVGEADVKAYVISNRGTSTQTINEITIEKYHEDMYLYFIAPEKITGYLVIVTSVSNSEVIVGENTAQVTDEILPEDGIYTFKYVVNHKNSVDDEGNPSKSYIYDSGISDNPERNLDLDKDLYIQFFDQVFDKESNKLKLVPKLLEKGTIIEVYYNLFINDSSTPTSSSVGTYVVGEGGASNMLLSAFKKLNNEEDFIDTPKFRDFLAGKEAVSEVYYFVVTPPNGYDKSSNKDGYGNIDNDVVFVGYYDPGKDDELKNENYKEYDFYVQGKRTGKSFANKPIQDQQGSFDEFKNETSLQRKIFALTPSRDTSLTVDGNTYKFKDNTLFNYLDIFMTNSAISNGVIRLEDNEDNNTIISSGLVEYGINKLSLELGYSTGNVDIYGSYFDTTTNTYKEELVSTINVDKIDYNKYEVEFSNDERIYYYFRIDNVSLSEIRLKEIILTDQYYLREYDISASTYKSLGVVDGLYKYVVIDSIVGDARHEGLHFMLALYLKNSSGIVVDIIETTPVVLNVSYIDAEGNTATGTITSVITASKGKMAIYYDLSAFLIEKNITEFTFTISELPDGYQVHCVQLIESSIIEKPAMGEVRVSIK
ncbi:MAG: hypothetical protein IJE45_06265 [Bacilli bacterium]|nr:hypothetical protein [Bacilli bacterium]